MIKELTIHDKKILVEEAYLYSLWSGQFKSYEGIVIQRTHNDGAFVAETRNLDCSLEEGIVYNATVWLSEKDDEQAKNILIRYEHSQITKLQEKIDNHLNKIKILEGK